MVSNENSYKAVININKEPPPNPPKLETNEIGFVNWNCVNAFLEEK